MPIVSLADELGEEVSRGACAYAVAMLAKRRDRALGSVLALR